MKDHNITLTSKPIFETVGEKRLLLTFHFKFSHFLPLQRLRISTIEGIHYTETVHEEEEANLNESRLFQRFLTFVKPRIAIETHLALTKHLETLGLITIEEVDKDKES